MTWMAVGAGGALGSMARHVVNMLFAHERSVPYATGAVNIVGADDRFARRVRRDRQVHMSNEWRTFVFVGILGGFTTFSSFMFDTFTVGHGGDHALAFWNVALQTALGLVAVWAGFRLGHLV
jgi:fluoride exporter